MHEFSLMNDLLRKIESIASENGATQVVGVKVRLGALSHISPEHFREHFDHAIEGTVAAGASLQVETAGDINDPLAQEIVLESVELAEE